MNRFIIETAHLFPLLDQKLIELLHSLSAEEWLKPTVAKQWCVQDVAAHLLDGNLRMLSLGRDGHATAPDKEIKSYQDLVSYLNQLNADWVRAAKRISPALLTDLLESTGKACIDYLESLDMHQNALFPVA